jgi:hypothetical protein
MATTWLPPVCADVPSPAVLPPSPLLSPPWDLDLLVASTPVSVPLKRPALALGLGDHHLYVVVARRAAERLHDCPRVPQTRRVANATLPLSPG